MADRNVPARVLIVEDDVEFATMLATLLKTWGYVVETVQTVPTALAKMGDPCPDLIISDLSLPGLDGLNLLRAIRARNPACDSVFFLLTGYASVAVGVTAIDAGADECLHKPIMPYDLQASMEKHGLYGMVA